MIKQLMLSEVRHRLRLMRERGRRRGRDGGRERGGERGRGRERWRRGEVQDMSINKR